MSYTNNVQFTGRITYIENVGSSDMPFYNIRMAVPESNMVDGSRNGYITIKARPATFIGEDGTWVYDPWGELDIDMECTIYCLTSFKENLEVELTGINVAQPERYADNSIKIAVSKADKVALRKLAKASYTSVSELIHTWISEKSEG